MKTNTKIFLKSFICSLIAFAIVSSFFILSQSGANASENSSYSSSNSRFKPKQSDTFTILLTISKDNTNYPHTVFLVNLNAFEGKVRVLRLPEVCVLSNKSQSKIILKECFQKSGEAAAAKAISQFFNINVSRYISFTEQNFISLIDLFEPTTVDISEDLSEINKKEDIYIKIDRGRRIISGTLMMDIFRYRGWKNGLIYSAAESSNTLCAFLSQNSSNIANAQEFIFQNAKTNLSVFDFESQLELIAYVFSLPDAFESIAIYGEYQLENTQFIFSSTTKTKIAALF